MFGFLNIYKPKGKTSHDVVAVLRKVTGIKQIGHTGTLDPFAEGVLPICIGKSTRLIEYLNDDKAYVGTIKLGEATTTFDIEGDVTNTSDKIVSLEDIELGLQKFRGNIVQVPPIYSAIKINGKKLYEYARNGEEVKIEPRLVTVDELKLLNYNKEKKSLELFISCSKGTYIRSIANDLGKELGTYGHLIKLVRVKAGDFTVNDSIQLDALNDIETVKEKILNPIKFLHNTIYELNSEEYKQISHGASIKAQYNNFTAGTKFITLTYKGNIVGIGELLSGFIKSKKIFC